MASNITGNVGMDGESIRRIRDAAQSDPNLLAQLVNALGLGSGGSNPAQATKLTGDVGLEPAITGSVSSGSGNPLVTMSGGGGGGGSRPPITGSGAEAPLPPGRGGGTSSIPNRTAGFSVNAPNQATGAGFESLLNQLRGGGRNVAEKLASPVGTRIAGLGAPTAFAVNSFIQGKPLQSAGELIGGLAGSGLVGGIAKTLESGGTKGKLLGGAVRLAGGLFGGGLGGAAVTGLGKLLGGGAQAAQSALGEAERRQMAQGESPGVIPGTGGKGIEGLTIAQLKELAMTQPEIMERLLPTINKERDAQMSRQMQLNQQLGQLTGALNQQKYMADLAGGAQSEAGATTRTMLTASNPYAASAFQYRG